MTVVIFEKILPWGSYTVKIIGSDNIIEKIVKTL